MTPAELFRLLFLPPAGFFMLMLCGWLLGRRRPAAGRAVVLLALAGLYVLATPEGADLLVAPLERRVAALTTAAAQAAGAEAIIVLAAGRLESAPEYDGLHIPDNIALARLRYAAHLQHATGLPLLVSGGNRARHAPHDTKAADMARALREDFRTEVTWLEDASETTAGNARLSHDMLRAAGKRRVLLVTDAMHMARAAPMFAATGLDVVAAPTMFYHLRRHEPDLFVPSAEGVRRSYYASYEWIGIFWYRIRQAWPASPATATPEAR